jgi:hypothetical protein
MKYLPLLCLLLASPALSVAPHTYSTSWFPHPVDSIETSLTWEAAPAGTNRFVATQFGLEGGDGGYVGLQQLSDGSTKAIFSIWGGVPVSPTCTYVTELGIEVSRCFIDYPWEFGQRYTFRMARVGTLGASHWYAAWATDEAGKDTLIGIHALPLQVTAISAWVNSFVELFGESECEGHAYTAVTFYPPTANSGTLTDLPQHRNHWASCEQGRSSEGYLHESGE